MRCFYCGSPHHIKKNCPKTWEGSVNRLHMRCSYCGATDHNINACPYTFSGSAQRYWHEDKIKDDFIKDR